MQGKYVGSCSGRKRKNPASQASPCLSWFCCASLPCRPAAICCYCCPAQSKHTIASGGILVYLPAALTWLPLVLAPPMRPLLARMLRWHKTFEYFFGLTYAYASMHHRPQKCHAVLRATGACSAIPPSPSTWRALGVRW